MSQQLRPGYNPTICPICGYDYTDDGGPLAAANCDCGDAA